MVRKGGVPQSHAKNENQTYLPGGMTQIEKQGGHLFWLFDPLTEGL